MTKGLSFSSLRKPKGRGSGHVSAWRSWLAYPDIRQLADREGRPDKEERLLAMAKSLFYFTY